MPCVIVYSFNCPVQVPVAPWDHVHPSLLMCASQGHVITPIHQRTCLQEALHPILLMAMLMFILHLMLPKTLWEGTAAPDRARTYP